MARRTRFRPFKPYRPPLPPTGSYDPNLGAARGAATRGIQDLRQDTALGASRADQDYTFGKEQVGTGLARAEEDYRFNTDMIRRRFDILAGQQQEQAAGAGVLSGGALLQAAAKRRDAHGLANLQQDISIGRARQDADTARGRLAVDWQRGATDRDTALTRAEREDTAFGLDTRAQMVYQAAGAGWSPPTPGQPGGMPRNEFTNRHGAQRRRIVRGGVEYVVAPDGTVVHSRRTRRR